MKPIAFHPRRASWSVMLIALATLACSRAKQPGPAPQGEQTAATQQAAAAEDVRTYHCKGCGRAIFNQKHVIREMTLADLGDYRADVYLLSDVIGLENLRHQDFPGHEAWYCCRFIVGRLKVDKFRDPTGLALNVYKDAVVAREPGQPAPASLHKRPQIHLTERDYDTVIADKSADTLRVVKVGAMWCGPCRLVDAIIERITTAGSHPDVEFFEVDSDESPELASRFPNAGIPYTLFYYRGERVRVKGTGLHILDGGIVGGMNQHQFETALARVLTGARAGKREILLD